MVDSCIFYFLFFILYTLTGTRLLASIRVIASRVLVSHARAQIFDFELDTPLVVPFVKFKLVNNVNLLRKV